MKSITEGYIVCQNGEYILSTFNTDRYNLEKRHIIFKNLFSGDIIKVRLTIENLEEKCQH